MFMAMVLIVLAIIFSMRLRALASGFWQEMRLQRSAGYGERNDFVRAKSAKLHVHVYTYVPACKSLD